mmetsp:Transcript_140145/g.244069  ORF Transcript_140145/g.244069 Transcript_140145/m.244069 type:complete len:238 (+) Transcript_140145:1715-2428(+)
MSCSSVCFICWTCSVMACKLVFRTPPSRLSTANPSSSLSPSSSSSFDSSPSAHSHSPSTSGSTPQCRSSSSFTLSCCRMSRILDSSSCFSSSRSAIAFGSEHTSRMGAWGTSSSGSSVAASTSSAFVRGASNARIVGLGVPWVVQGLLGAGLVGAVSLSLGGSPVVVMGLVPMVGEQVWYGAAAGAGATGEGAIAMASASPTEMEEPVGPGVTSLSLPFACDRIRPNSAACSSNSML